MLNSLLYSEDRGFVYSLFRVVLPFETTLFLVCIQFSLWLTILIPAAIGFVALMRYRRSDVLYAVSREPLGPFVKANDNPITACTDEITETGRGCLVDTPGGIMAV